MLAVHIAHTASAHTELYPQLCCSRSSINLSLSHTVITITLFNPLHFPTSHLPPSLSLSLFLISALSYPHIPLTLPHPHIPLSLYLYHYLTLTSLSLSLYLYLSLSLSLTLPSLYPHICIQLLRVLCTWHCDEFNSPLDRGVITRVLQVLHALHYTLLWCNTVHCPMLQHTTLYCNTPQCAVQYTHSTAVYCSEVQYTTLYCSALQCTAQYSNILHYKAVQLETHSAGFMQERRGGRREEKRKRGGEGKGD